MSAPVFARHETFHPRHHWLKKGFDAASANSEVFLTENAHVTLGVGKNMVRSIRYWCHAFKILEDDPNTTGRARGSRPSDFGRLLLGDQGVDRYLEKLSSLWLLHWRLLSEPCEATAWFYTFFQYARPELSVAELTNGLLEYVDRFHPTARAAESSLKKDVTCILRMYGDVSVGHKVTEESLQSPFADLGLIRPTGRSRSYSFRVGAKPGLSAEIIATACLEYAARVSGGAQTIAMARLLRDPGSPGLAFRLSEATLYGALEAVAEREPGLNLSDTAGVIQLAFDQPPAETAQSLLLAYYGAYPHEVSA